MRIGDYEVLDRADRNEIGNVFRAISVEEKDERLYAMKVFPNKRPRKIDVVVYFTQQADKLIPLHHENITRVYEHGSFKTALYYVMEYIDGCTLQKSISSRGIFSERQALSIAQQLVSAVEYLWKNEFFYYNITPHSIMISDNNIKLFDLIKINVEDCCITVPYYTSPEQIREEKMDERSNIFTIGVILYYMLTGTPPFSGKDPNAIYSSILASPFVNILQQQSQVCDATHTVIKRMTMNEKNARYQSYAAVMEDLQKAICSVESA